MHVCTVEAQFLKHARPTEIGQEIGSSRFCGKIAVKQIQRKQLNLVGNIGRFEKSRVKKFQSTVLPG